MKTNFVVSNCYDVWIPDKENLFMVNPFIEHKLELDGIKDSYKNIEIASLRRTNRQELENDHDLVDMKVRKYTKILKRLFFRLLPCGQIRNTALYQYLKQRALQGSPRMSEQNLV